MVSGRGTPLNQGGVALLLRSLTICVGEEGPHLQSINAVKSAKGILVFEFFLTLLGLSIGTIFVVLVLLVALPIYSSGNIFTNTPGGSERSGFHLFTKLESGQIKLIVRGDKLVRMIMNTPGERFARVGTRNDPGYWELIPGVSEDPTFDIHPLVRPWAKLVYELTGSVFTGIYPFQRVYEYRLPRTNVIRKESGRTTASNLVLTDKIDISDHFRSRQFLFPVHVTAAETKDKIPLDVIGVCDMRVTNPYKAAYGTDSWNETTVNMVSNTIVELAKQLNLDTALTADSREGARVIPEAVEGLTDDTDVCGTEITKFRVLEVNPALDKEGLTAIQAEAFAKQKAKGTVIDGEARKRVLELLNEANRAGGDISVRAMELEAAIKMAEAAGKGGGTVFLNPQGGTSVGKDPVMLAILAELKKLNKE